MAFPTGWQYYIAITLDHTKISADLTDWTFVFDETFAAVLTAANGPLDSSGTNPMNSDGSDIRFSTDSAGANEIPVDVRGAATAAGGGGTLEVAVKIPTVSSSADTVIYMWWGNSSATLPAASSTYGQYNAYDANYQQVFSFSGGPSSFTDRTSNQTTASSSGGTVASAAGKVGDAYEITAAGAALTLATSLSAAQETAGATIEFLFNFTSGPGEFKNMIAQSAAALGLYLDNSSPMWYDGGSNYLTTGAITAGAWHHYQITIDTTPTLTIYQDNVSALSKAFVTATDINAVGNDASAESLAGLWDELRISLVTRSTAWLTAGYYNVMEHTLSTFGTVTAVGVGAATIAMAGIASSEADGTPTVSASIGAAAIASGEALGAASVSGTISASGVASAETFGSPTVAAGLLSTIVNIGIASVETFGSPTVASAATRDPKAPYQQMTGPEAAKRGVALPRGLGSPARAVTAPPRSPGSRTRTVTAPLRGRR